MTTPTCLTKSVKFNLLTPLGNSVPELKMKPQSPFFEVEDYYSSDSYPPSSRKTVFSQFETKLFHTVIMLAMMIGAVNLEEELANIKATLEKLSKESPKKDAHIKCQEEHIAKLMKKLEKGPRAWSNEGASNDEDKKGSTRMKLMRMTTGQKRDATHKNDSSSSSMNAEQIQKLIANAVKSQPKVSSQKSLLCTKPYTKRIDALCMPYGYQPFKSNQFEHKGNLKQHVAHFIKTCNNVGTGGDLVVKQFVQTLKDIKFDWYTDLLPESIDTWEQMEQKFLNWFHSIQCTVSMTELTKY